MDDTSSGKDTKTEWVRWVTPAVATVVAVIIGALLPQLFYSGNIAEEQRQQLRRDLIVENYPLLQKAHRLSSLGSEINIIVFQQVYSTPDGQIIGKASEGYDLFLPRVVYDADSHGEWQRVMDDLIRNRDFLLPAVSNRVERIRDFVSRHPFPDTPSLPAIINSDYSREDVSASFSALHDALEMEISNTTRLR